MGRAARWLALVVWALTGCDDEGGAAVSVPDAAGAEPVLVDAAVDGPPPGDDADAGADGGGLDAEADDPDTGPRGPTLGGDRPAAVVLPADFSPDRRWPLIIVLHGYSVNGLIVDRQLGLSDRVSADGFVLVVPEGLRDARGARHWNDRADGGGEPDDVAYLRGLIAEAIERYAVDPERVYVVGHSNGGHMSYRMACEASDVVTAIAPLSATIAIDEARCEGGRPVSVLHIHGVGDTSVRYEGTEERLGRWAQRLRCGDGPIALGPFDYDQLVGGADSEVVSWAECQEGADVALWRMPDAGHVLLLTEEGSAELVAFLLRHRRTQCEAPERRWRDRDRDGFGTVEEAVCLPAERYAERGGDCDDRNPDFHPEAVEVCGSGYDEDCDGEDAQPALVAGPFEPVPLAPGMDALVAFALRGGGYGLVADYAGTLRYLRLGAAEAVELTQCRRPTVVPDEGGFAVACLDGDAEQHRHLLQRFDPDGEPRDPAVETARFEGPGARPGLAELDGRYVVLSAHPGGLSARIWEANLTPGPTRPLADGALTAVAAAARGEAWDVVFAGADLRRGRLDGTLTWTEAPAAVADHGAAELRLTASDAASVGLADAELLIPGQPATPLVGDLFDLAWTGRDLVLARRHLGGVTLDRYPAGSWPLLVARPRVLALAGRDAETVLAIEVDGAVGLVRAELQDCAD